MLEIANEQPVSLFLCAEFKVLPLYTNPGEKKLNIFSNFCHTATSAVCTLALQPSQIRTSVSFNVQILALFFRLFRFYFHTWMGNMLWFLC